MQVAKQMHTTSNGEQGADIREDEGPPHKRARLAHEEEHTTLVLQPACNGTTPTGPQQEPESAGSGDPAGATSLRDFYHRQRDVLTELHALYQKEYARLKGVLNSAHTHACASDQPMRQTAHDNPDDHPHGTSPSQHQIQQQQQQQPTAGPSPPPPRHGPGHEPSAACSADTSAGRPVASFNNWMGTLASSGTPQSGYRVDGASSGAGGSSSKETAHAPSVSNAIPVEPLSTIAEEPPSTPTPCPLPSTEQIDGPPENQPTPAAQDSLADGDQPKAPAADTSTAQPSAHAQDDSSQQQPHTDPGNATLASSMQTPTSTRPNHPQPMSEDDQGMQSDHENAVVQHRGEVEGGHAIGAVEVAVKSTQPRFGGAAAVERLLQLESLASAITEQELDLGNALACLLGYKGRYLIRQNTVLLGRNTESKGEADIDLSEEGPAAQVSRRQAYLTVQPDGRWALTNTGRRPVRVDGCTVAQFGVAHIQHASLLEVGGILLMFMVNLGACERMLRRTQRGAA